MTSFLVVAYDKIGERMAGPGVRSWELAHSIVGAADVVVASAEPIERSSATVHTVHFETEAQLAQLVVEADVVLVQGLALRRHECLRNCDAVLVVDLYDPWVLENLELHAARPDVPATATLFADAGVQNELADHGDMFICASERQRDYWLGMLTSRLRLDRATWADDHELRDLIDVVPYGAPERRPKVGSALRGVHPNVSDEDVIFLWSGGTWEWFDPLVVLDGFAAAQSEHPSMVLYFMGLGIAGRTPDMPVAQRLHDRAVELGLLGDRVIFGDWVLYDERDAHLLEADAAVLATRPSAESRLAFRSRMLDHFWTSLPTLTTPGDALADLVDREGAGALVPYDDATAWKHAMLDIARDREARERMAAAAGALAAKFRWSDAGAPLRRVATDPQRWLSVRERRQVLREACSFPTRGIPDQFDLGDGFHSRGAFIDRLKRSGVYPLLRRVRRSRLGIRIWGTVPGE